MKLNRIGIAAVLALLVSCGGDEDSSTGPTVVTPTPTLPSPTEVARHHNRVGFFNPLETVSDLTGHMAFGMINSYSIEQVERSLSVANGGNYKVKIDFSDLLLQRADPEKLSMTYIDSIGTSRTKKFQPLSNQKLRWFPANIVIADLIAPYIQVMKAHSQNVGTLFLADEPYLNGVSKAEMERAGSVVRQELDRAGLQQVKLGVIFASGMFNSDFAQHLNRASGEYVRRIDAYYERGLAVRNGSLVDPDFDVESFDDWIESVEQFRLTTYDAAGNMYTGGGIPSGFDVVAFDFYLSTALLDDIHENSLSWFAARYPNGSCSQYAGKAMNSIRTSLSFFQDGPIKQGEPYQVADREILDDLFQCRMTATLDLMRQAVQGTSVKFMMISESSSNGVFEFYSNGRPKTAQPKLLIEARVLDEVNRALDFYTANKGDFVCGIMFFVYNDAYDYSINIPIYGASSLPSVIDRIFAFSAAEGPSTTGQCD